MKLVLVALSLAVAGSASAQTMGGGVVGGVLTPPPSTLFGTQFRTGRYDAVTRDDLSTRIDRRNSARFEAAKTARKARERARREARRTDRG